MYRDTTHSHPFNGPFSGTTRVNRYQKGKTILDFTEERDSEWQWHQLSHMQVCTSLQTDNHASTRPLKFFTGRVSFLPPNQQRQSTEGTILKATQYIVSSNLRRRRRWCRARRRGRPSRTRAAPARRGCTCGRRGARPSRRTRPGDA